MDVLKRPDDSDKIRPTVEEHVTILDQLQSDAQELQRLGLADKLINHFSTKI